MKHNAIVGNIGQFDNEIDMAALAKFPGIQRINISRCCPRVSRIPRRVHDSRT